MKSPNTQQLKNLTLQKEHQSNPPVHPSNPLLGIDYGEKWTGIAYSPDGVVTLPLDVVETHSLIQYLQKISHEKEIFTFIIGVPLEKDGSDNILSLKIRHFFAEFENNPLYTIRFVNERHSSQNVIAPKKGKPRIDDLAAAQILEFWMRQK